MLINHLPEYSNPTLRFTVGFPAGTGEGPLVYKTERKEADQNTFWASLLPLFDNFGLFALERAVDGLDGVLVVGGVEHIDGVLIATGGYADNDMTVVVGDL